MGAEKLERTMAQMHEDCSKLALRLAHLTEADLAKPTPHDWAPTVGEFIAAVAEHKRDHVQQIATKRKALGLEQSPAQKSLADAMAAQGELNGGLIGLTDEDLEPVPEGQTWSIGQALEHVAGTDGWFLSEIEKVLKG